MNIIDVLIILIVLLFGIVGFHRGLFKELVMTIGWIIVFLIAWYIKNPVASFLSYNLPFIDFGGVLKGVTIINILFYHTISFIIIYSLLMVGFNLLIKLTGLLESLLKATIILGIPSKVLGFIVGLIEGYIVAFLFLFIIALPVFNLEMVQESSFKNNVLNKTPIFSNLTRDVTETISEIDDLKDNYTSDSTKEEFNRECIRVMLDHNIITPSYVRKLSEVGKIRIKNINELIERYE